MADFAFSGDTFRGLGDIAKASLELSVYGDDAYRKSYLGLKAKELSVEEKILDMRLKIEEAKLDLVRGLTPHDVASAVAGNP